MTLQAGYEPLLKSISEGDLTTLKHLINTGKYSVNEEVRYYSEDDKNYIITPLYWAVKLNKREVCGYLLKHGADPYKHMVYEFYPLHEACNNGNYGIVQEFIRHSCNLNKKNCDGDTPLHIACLRGNIECIQLLVAAGSSRCERNNKGQTPLQVAQFDQQKELYKLFNAEQSSTSMNSVIRSHPVAQRPNQIGSSTVLPARRHSLTNHCQKQPRPLSYHSTTQDCFNIGSNQRIKSLRSDITRTYSFSGTNNSASVHRHNDSTRHNDTLPVSSNNKELNTSPSKKSPRPSLSYMSHDSQLVLPTQKIVPDPRRTKTCHEFQNLPLKFDSTQVNKTPSPEPAQTPDDIEVDGRPSNSLAGGRLRVNHMVQCMHPVLKSRDVTDTTSCSDVHSDCLLKVLYSIHREIGFSDDEYSAINQLILERDQSIEGDRLMLVRDQPPGLEYVWGCDYDLVDTCHPLQVVKDYTKIDHLEMTFHVRLNTSQASKNDKDSILKVLVQLLNLEDTDQFDSYINRQVLLCREGRIMSAIPPHPNIVKKFHHCLANSRPFERFTRHLCFADDGQQNKKLSSQCSLLFTDYFPTSLKDVFNIDHHSPSIQYHCITEQSFLIYISQLLLAILHLDRHNIIFGHVSESQVFIQHSHLYFADFAFAFDLLECEADNAASLKEWLLTVPKDSLLEFPPELNGILKTPSFNSTCEDEAMPCLDKCSVYCVGKLFNKLLPMQKSDDVHPHFINISEQSRYLLKNLVSDSISERFSSIDAVLYCLALQFGPLYDKCKTVESCQEWLMTETFHLFLQPSLKGHPTTYPASIRTKLLFTYLCIATPEKLLQTIKRISQLSTPANV